MLFTIYNVISSFNYLQLYFIRGELKSGWNRRLTVVVGAHKVTSFSSFLICVGVKDSLPHMNGKCLSDYNNRLYL